MLKLWLIRHGQTPGNRLGRYIGTTDEPLSQEGIRALQGLSYGSPGAVYTSPLLRCVQTAELLFPDKSLHIIQELSECDFGEFENKNYRELSGNPRYQAWIDSNGTMDFPGGESREAFRQRSIRGFLKAVDGCIRQGARQGAIVTHGGVIMNLMETYAGQPGDFYRWHIQNGGAYLLSIDPTPWQKGRQTLEILKKQETN